MVSFSLRLTIITIFNYHYKTRVLSKHSTTTLPEGVFPSPLVISYLEKLVASFKLGISKQQCIDYLVSQFLLTSQKQSLLSTSSAHPTLAFALGISHDKM